MVIQMQLNDGIQKIRKEMELFANKQMKPLLQAYKRSFNRIQEQIGKIYMEYSQDGELKISRSQRYTVLKQLEKNLVSMAKELNGIDLKNTTKILEDIFKELFYRTVFLIEAGTEVVIDLSILRPEFIKAAVKMPIKGEMFSKRIWDNKKKLIKRLRRELESGMIEGISIDKMARKIKRQFGVSAYESKRLVHTEMARCMTHAQDEVYRNSGVVGKVMFDATLDEKTSNKCQHLDGKVFDINSNYPKPPVHPNCRSCIVPVVDGWSPRKKRENVKGSDREKDIIDYMDYEQWKSTRID